MVEIDDEVGFLGDRQEFAGQHQPLAALPAHQSFDADDAAGAAVDLRLVVEGQVAVAQTAAQAAFQLDARVHARRQFAGVETERIAAVALGQVHRRVGTHHQGGRIVAILGEQADADAEGLVQLVRGHRVGRAADRQQSLCDQRDAVAVDHVVQQHDELVAAGPVDRAQVADVALDPLGHLLQQLIADVVAQRVVDVLEQIQIDEQHRDTGAAMGGVGDRLRQRLVELEAVGQGGQRVVMRQIGHARAERALLGDVAQDHDRSHQAVVVPVQGRDGALHQHPSAVPPSQFQITRH